MMKVRLQATEGITTNNKDHNSMECKVLFSQTYSYSLSQRLIKQFCFVLFVVGGGGVYVCFARVQCKCLHCLQAQWCFGLDMHNYVV